MKLSVNIKNLKKGGVSIKFPRNYRVIPESWTRDELAFFIGALVILGAIFVIVFDLFSNLRKEKELTNAKFSILKAQAFWSTQVEEKPNYRDAYFELALTDYQLNEMSKAKSDLAKALNLDPNFKEGKDLEKILGE